MVERLLALAVLVASGAYLAAALPLPRGTAARPGAGFFPTFVAVFGCLAGVGMTVHAFLTTVPARAPRDAGAGRDARNRALSTMIVLVAFCALLPWLGYPLVAFAFVTGLLQRLGSAWFAAAVIGVLTAALSYYIFGVLLDVPLPRGPW